MLKEGESLGRSPHGSLSFIHSAHGPRKPVSWEERYSPPSGHHTLLNPMAAEIRATKKMGRQQRRWVCSSREVRSSGEPRKRKRKQAKSCGKSIPGRGTVWAKAKWLDAVWKGEDERPASMSCRTAAKGSLGQGLKRQRDRMRFSFCKELPGCHGARTGVLGWKQEL